MGRMTLIVALGAMLALACGQGPAETKYDVTTLVLPEGRPEAGRDAFLKLGCMSCHSVAWDEGLPAPVAAVSGPELGTNVGQIDPGRIATSIVAPSHQVAEKYRGIVQGGGSPMSDYTGVMTIRQLADIVAYLQRQGLETQARTGSGG